jgi:pyridoxal phosphate enzyme (YggS family)
MTIAENLQHVQERIAAACARAGRDPAQVTLVAVSKTHPAELVLEAIEAGLQHFGENRVEEANVKIPQVAAQTEQPIRWHMVGHIQSRKAKLIPPLFDVVHSVDDLKLAIRLSVATVDEGKLLDVLLQVNVSGEETKSGIQAVNWEKDAAVREHVLEQCQEIIALPNVKVRGLMTMAPIVGDMEQARPIFASLAALRAMLSQGLNVPLPDLSMGMTDDYPIAIEEGATLIRVGRAIFGERL